jgi:HEAT repeat protein
MALAGCTDTQMDATVQKLLKPRKTPQQYMLTAVSDEDPDLRRDAVARVADSNKGSEEWAIKGYVAIALLENDHHARCVALRALAATGDPRATETALKILHWKDEPPAEVRPPDKLVRWDALAALADLSKAGRVPPESADRVRDTLVEGLKGEPDRNARITAARGLGCYATDAVLKALIDALKDKDFAVCHAVEGSLVELTGVTNGCSHQAWKDWYTANQSAPFALAGQVPESRRPPYDSKLGKAMHDGRQFWTWLFPGEKQ